MDWTRHSPYTDPGRHAALLAALPADVPSLTAVVRNVLVHYRASGLPFPPDRLAEIDSRWLERLLDADRSRFDTPLDAPRASADRVVGCCRDFTLLTVAALRAHGIAARSRIGFASYFRPDFHDDHVIAEYRVGGRWRCVDAQLDPELPWPVDRGDVPLGPDGLETAAQVWTAHRRGELDVEKYGVAPELPVLRGEWFVRNYVLAELAHRQGDELLLWDGWGAMTGPRDSGGVPSDVDRADLDRADEVAAVLLAADAGDDDAERRLARWYAEDPRLHPGDEVLCRSPRGTVVSERVGRRVDPAPSTGPRRVPCGPDRPAGSCCAARPASGTVPPASCPGRRHRPRHRHR